MSALLDSLLAGHDDAASRAILDIGLPGPRSEAWKYTPLRAFERRTFSPARVIEADTGWLAGIPAPVSYTHLDVYKRQAPIRDIGYRHRPTTNWGRPRCRCW